MSKSRYFLEVADDIESEPGGDGISKQDSHEYDDDGAEKVEAVDPNRVHNASLKAKIAQIGSKIADLKKNLSTKLSKATSNQIKILQGQQAQLRKSIM